MEASTVSSRRPMLQPSLPHRFSPLRPNFSPTSKARGKSVSSPRHRARELVSPSGDLRDDSVQKEVKSDMPDKKTAIEACKLKDVSTPFVSRRPAFADLLGPAPRLRLLLRDSKGRPLFHEAGIYHPSTASVYLSTNRLPMTDVCNSHHQQMVGIVRIDLTKLPDAARHEPCPLLEDFGDVIQLCQTLPPHLAMPNGATSWKQDGQQTVLWCEQGRHSLDTEGKANAADDVHAALVCFNPTKWNDLASASTVVALDNYNGKRFSSLNDVVVHEQSGVIFFTDPDYGVEQNFKRSHEEEEYAPNALYAWYPPTGEVRLIDDRYDKPNGVTFVPSPSAPQSGCGLLCTTDTGAFTFARDAPLGTLKLDYSRPLTIYTYTVEPAEDPSVDPFPWVNVHERRVLAHSECGAPDGIHPDEKGNIWVGSGDGVHIYDPYTPVGTSCSPLLGKIVLPSGRGVANFCWAGPVESGTVQTEKDGSQCVRADIGGEFSAIAPGEVKEKEGKQYRLLLFAEDELWELHIGVNGRD